MRSGQAAWMTWSSAVRSRAGDTLARLRGDELAVHASIGIAVVEAPMATPPCENLLGNADIAMYEAKNNGKNKMSLFRPGMRLANAVDAFA